MYLTVKGSVLDEGLDSQTVERIVDFYQANPIEPFSTMEFEPFETENFDKEKIVAFFQTNEIPSFATESYIGTDDWIGGSISFHNIQYNLGGIEFSDKYLLRKDIFDNIKPYLQEWRHIFPGFTNSSATSDDRDNEFWLDVAKTPPLPDCLGSRLGWYHVVSERGYEPFFRREDLLNAPVLHIEELADGTICLQSYDHPLDYSKPDTTKKIIEITNYLYQKWREFDPSPTI